MPRTDADDKATIAAFGHQVCRAAIDSEALVLGERQAHVERAVRTMQAEGAFYPSAFPRAAMESADA